MGCFFACFGSSKDRKRVRHRLKVQGQPREIRNPGSKQTQPNVFVAQNNPGIPSAEPVLEIRVKPEKQLSLRPLKRVTFDSNVTAYEHVPVAESVDSSVEKGDSSERKEEEDNLTKQGQSQSTIEESLVNSSSGNYPSNHRYQNCRDSDDELDYGENDSDNEDDDGRLDYDDTCGNDGNLGSKPVSGSSLPEKEVNQKPNARDRSAYVHSVLNPVENLMQWKAVKAKGTPSPKQQKENLTSNQEPRISCSSEPSLKEKSDRESKKPSPEISVDASLSSWLGSSESRPSSASLCSITPEKSSVSKGSNSSKSFDDRPILGALTLEEIKQFSATNSPKRSPSRSPDDMPIIGTVGTYWNQSSLGKEPRSASSFKGIPNTTSKYREDKRVNWHSTPFETRLERALNGTTTTAC